jgi:hypothetical protein
LKLKGMEMTGAWRRLHNEELHNLYISPLAIRVIKSRSMKWTGCVVVNRIHLVQDSELL